VKGSVLQDNGRTQASLAIQKRSASLVRAGSHALLANQLWHSACMQGKSDKYCRGIAGLALTWALFRLSLKMACLLGCIKREG
jgi:hypothetical protein